MVDLEKKLGELLQELLQKRRECEELQQRHNSEVLAREELKTEIEGLRADAENLGKQLALTNKALHRCEESYSGAREAAVKHHLGLDAATKSIEAMRDQATKLHMDNVKLKKQLEEKDRDTKAESFFRESCVSKQMKTQAIIESLTAQMRNLEKDSRDIERHAEGALSVGKKTKLMLQHKDAVVAEMRARTTDLSAQLVNLTSENRRLKEQLKDSKPPEQHYVKEILQEWERSVSEGQARAVRKDKEVETLHQALQNALDGQLRFQRLEAAANDRVKDLEEKIMSDNKKEKKNRTDCSVQTDLDISIDVACATDPVFFGSASTQTEAETTVQTSSKETGMEAVDQDPEDMKEHSVRVPKTSLTVSTPVLNNNPCSSGSSLQQLMAKYQMGLELSPRLKEFSDMPTQPNCNIKPE